MSEVKKKYLFNFYFVIEIETSFTGELVTEYIAFHDK
jgi:hypothetical protein